MPRKVEQPHITNPQPIGLRRVNRPAIPLPADEGRRAPVNGANEHHLQEHYDARNEAQRRGGYGSLKRLHNALLALANDLPKVPAEFDAKHNYRVKLGVVVPANSDGYTMLRPMQDVIVRGDFANKIREQHGQRAILGAQDLGPIDEGGPKPEE